MKDIHAVAAKYIQEKNLSAALNVYEEMLKENPNDPLIFANIANVVYMLKEFDRAVSLYKKAIALDEQCAVAYYGLGNVFYAKEDFSQAAVWFEQAIRHGLTEDGDVYFLLGVSLMEMQQARLASMYLLRATELKAEDPEIWFMYGLCMGKCEVIDESIRALQIAIQIDDTHADAHYNLGVAYFMCENQKAAHRHILYTLQLQPEHLLAKHALRILTSEMPKS